MLGSQTGRARGGEFVSALRVVSVIFTSSARPAWARRHCSRRLMIQDATSGAGMVVVDPLGDLTDLLAERLPQSRWRDLVIVDPTDDKRPVGFNLLMDTATPRAMEFIVGSMSQMFANSWGPRTADILRAGLLTLARNRGATLADLPDLLVLPNRRMKWVAAVAHDSILSGFWQWYDDLSQAERAHVIAPLMNKLRSWLLRGEVVRTICHPSGTLSFRDVFTRRKILVLRLPKGVLGEEVAALIGSLLLGSLWRSVLARGNGTRHTTANRLPVPRRIPGLSPATRRNWRPAVSSTRNGRCSHRRAPVPRSAPGRDAARSARQRWITNRLPAGIRRRPPHRTRPRTTSERKRSDGARLKGSGRYHCTAGSSAGASNGSDRSAHSSDRQCSRRESPVSQAVRTKDHAQSRSGR